MCPEKRSTIFRCDVTCWRSSRINETVVTMIKAKLMYENAIASRLELGSFSTSWRRYDSAKTLEITEKWTAKKKQTDPNCMELLIQK